MQRVTSATAPLGLIALLCSAVVACDGGDGIEPVPTSASSATTIAVVTTAIDEGLVGSELAPPSTAASTTTSTTTTMEPSRVWGDVDQVNIMLLGSDAGVGRTGTRTDTIILMTIDPETGDAAMFSVPRNLTEAPLPDGMGVWGCDCFPDIITHLWANAEWFPDAFPGPQEPPINALKASLGLILGVEVHYYAMVDLAGFVAMIDAIGGVTIDVPKRIVDEQYPHENGGTEYIAIDEGEQVLDGHAALAYARIRRNSGDFARMHRQRCLLGAVVENLTSSNLASGSAALAEALEQSVDTDIPLAGLSDFVDLALRLELDRLATLRITRYNYATEGDAGYQLYDLERIRADAHILMENPAAHLDTQDGVGWDETCAQSFD